jgi:tetratricopeptide (TPR) repeat protein
MDHDVVDKGGYLQRAADFFFGYDFFLSYSHSDGKNYAALLKTGLAKAGFKVFLDQTDYVAGLDLRRETRRQVRKSRSFVLVGRAGSLVSGWVGREVDVALESGKTPILIDVNGAVEAAPPDAVVARIAREQHWLRLLETIPTSDAAPSESTLAELIRGFAHTRQETLRQRVLAITAAAFAVISAFAGLSWWRAEIERDKAEQTTAIATNAANDLVFKIAGRFREQEGMPQAVVTAILEQAQQVTARLSQIGKPRADVLRSSAAALAEVSFALRRQGKHQDAIEAAGKAVEGFKRLTALEPEDNNWLSDLASGYDRLGEALRAGGRWDDAVKAFEQGRDITLRLLARDSENLGHRRLAALSFEKIGDTLVAAKKLDAALDAFRRSRAMRTELVAKDSHPDLKRELAISHERIGSVLLAQNNAMALGEYEHSVELSREIALGSPMRTDLQIGLAQILQQVGTVYRGQRRFPDAVKRFDDAARISWRLATADTLRDDWQLEAAKSKSLLGEALRDNGQLAEAVEQLQQSVAVFSREERTHREWRRAGYTAAAELGDTLMRLRRYQEALDPLLQARGIAERILTADGPDDAFDLKLIFISRQEADVRVALNAPREALDAHERLLATLRRTGERHSLSANALAEALGNLSWYALIANEIPRALAAAQDGFRLAPGFAWIEGHLAHALMLMQRPDEARLLYLSRRGLPDADRSRWSASIKADFRRLREAGLTHPLMQEIEDQFGS